MTIYALSSGPGISGIAVIRVSGDKTKEIISSITKGNFPKARIATLKQIINPKSGELVDEGLIIFFKNPIVILERIWQNFMYMEAKL